MCGVFGIYDSTRSPDRDVARLTFFGLLRAPAPRTGELPGIAVSNGEQVMAMTDMGLVSQVFDEFKLSCAAGPHGDRPRPLFDDRYLGVAQRPAGGGARPPPQGRARAQRQPDQHRRAPRPAARRRRAAALDVGHRGDRSADRPPRGRGAGRRGGRHDEPDRGGVRRRRHDRSTPSPVSATPTGSARWWSAASTAPMCLRPRPARSTSSARSWSESWARASSSSSTSAAPVTARRWSAAAASLCIFEYIYFARPDSPMPARGCTTSAAGWASSSPSSRPPTPTS